MNSTLWLNKVEYTRAYARGRYILRDAVYVAGQVSAMKADTIWCDELTGQLWHELIANDGHELFGYELITIDMPTSEHIVASWREQ